MIYNHDFKHGAFYLGQNKCRFSVWAPHIDTLSVHVFSEQGERAVSLKKDGDGYFGGILDQIKPGDQYFYRLNNQTDRPDPASRFQTGSVHAESQIVDPSYSWTDDKWTGLALEKYILYELHAGAYSKEETFDGILSRLDYLKELGVTAVELMPVAQFPGSRNWGYDGVFPFAVQDTYGGPRNFKKLVNACHEAGLAVVLDVVYNHLGPEGNYCREFGPYFTDRYQTPWGPAINFDGPDSDPVRRFFIENALMWIHEFHIDALRLDAIHAICDFSAYPFLAQLADDIHALGKKINRPVYLFPESDLNDTRLIRPRSQGGFAHDAQWSDDYHHALHAFLTGERQGYYQDFGKLNHLLTAMTEAFVYSGRYSKFRRRHHGNTSADLDPRQFIVFSQNHDQVGNRLNGDRLARLVSFEEQKLAAGLVLLSPYIPLLFMGEEYGETAPFLYFVSHGDPDLVRSVREGRREEFRAFDWKGKPPDPQSEETFNQCKLNDALLHEPRNAALLDYYKMLIQLRKTEPAFLTLTTDSRRAGPIKGSPVLWNERKGSGDMLFILFNFDSREQIVKPPLRPGAWTLMFDSADTRWEGPGSRLSGDIISSDDPTIALQPASVITLKKKED